MTPAQEPGNYLDADGLRICMVCGRSIRPAEFATFVDDCLVHGRCMREARLRCLSPANHSGVSSDATSFLAAELAGAVLYRV